MPVAQRNILFLLDPDLHRLAKATPVARGITFGHWLVDFVQSYPIIASGKVQKFALRAPAIKFLGMEDVAQVHTALGRGGEAH